MYINFKNLDIATVVEVDGSLGEIKNVKRVMTFYHEFPRIDFDVYIEDIPHRCIVFAEFPLSDEVIEIRRGIPYGFSHGWWNEKKVNLYGKTDGIPFQLCDGLTIR